MRSSIGSGRIGIGLGVARRRLRTRRAAPGAVILAYHDVVDAPTDEPWSVPADDFAGHLEVLVRLGLRIVDLRTIVELHSSGRPVDGLAAITFDDALLGVHEHALPILRRAGAPATIFVVSDHLGAEPPWWPAAPRTMTAAELGDATEAGIRIASHTRTHRSLLSIDDDALRSELAGSRDRLAALTTEPVDLFAYPSGHHDPRVRRVVGESGYVAGFTFLNGRILGGEDPLRLPRLTMGRHLGPTRLAYQLRRDPESWPDHQLDVVAAGDR